jgi:hypothetical protein
MFALSLNSLLMSVRTEFSERIRSMVVRLLLSLSRGVFGSSALFCAWSIRVCSWTMGGRSSETCTRAGRIVRLGVFGVFASNGIEREELRDLYGPVRTPRLPLAKSDGAEGGIAGTLGEKRLTYGLLLGAAPSPKPLSLHISLRSSPPNGT